MRGKILLITLGASAIIIAASAVAFYAVGAPAQSAGEAKELGIGQRYTLKSENGRLTVYSESPGVPEIETEIDTSGLRQYDRELLEKGLDVDGYEQMIGLLEDFSN